MKARHVRAVVAHTDGQVTDEVVLDDLVTWQRLVGGDIEGVVLGPAATVYCNGTGLLDGLPHNPLAAEVVPALRPDLAPTLATFGLRGDVVFVGYSSAGNTLDCPAAIAALIEHTAAGLR